MKFKGTAGMMVVFLCLGIYYFFVDLPAEKKKTKGQACVDIKKINAGDTLFIINGKKGLFGVGVATGTYEYHPEAELMHQVPVKWISKQYVEWYK